MFELRLLGSAELLDAGAGAVAPVQAQPKRFALLAYLAAARPLAFHSRDSLVALLWPELDAEHARGALNSALYFLRKFLEPGVVVSRGENVAVDRHRLRCDAVAYRNAVAAGRWRHALELFRGDLLPGFFITGAPEFERWLDLEREALRREAGNAAWALVEELEREGESVAARAWGERAVSLFPFDEIAVRRQLTLLDRQGDWSAAIRTFNAFRERLRSELGIEPSPVTCEMIDAMRPAAFHGGPRGRVRATQVALTLSEGFPQPALSDPVVAVVRFRAIGAGAQTRWFADGLTEDLIGQMAKMRGLRVISRSSSLRLRRGEDETDLEFAEQVGATYVLTGSVRGRDGLVRVSTHLIDPRTDQHLWTETYDRRGSDIFEIQSEIALKIAAALGARMTRELRLRVATPGTTSLTAQRLYLRGRDRLLRFTERGFRGAIESFERAAAADPAFARPHADAAVAWAVLGMGHGAGALPPAVGYERGMQAVENALRLDPTLGPAHAARGLLLFQYAFDWTGAETECRDALRLTPGDAMAHAIYGLLLSALRRYGEAIAEQSLAWELDPLTPVAASDLATTLLRAGQYDEALSVSERLMQLEPEFPMAHSTRGWGLILRGPIGEGLAALEHAVELSPGNTLFLAQLGQAYAMTGDRARGRAILERLQALGSERYVSPYHLAYVYAGLGRHAEAIGHLEKACAERSGGIYGLGGSFLFESLHSEPAFQNLMTRMNLEVPVGDPDLRRAQSGAPGPSTANFPSGST